MQEVELPSREEMMKIFISELLQECRDRVYNQYGSDREKMDGSTVRLLEMCDVVDDLLKENEDLEKGSKNKSIVIGQYQDTMREIWKYFHNECGIHTLSVLEAVKVLHERWKKLVNICVREVPSTENSRREIAATVFIDEDIIRTSEDPNRTILYIFDELRQKFFNLIRENMR